jgi:hypothetical protein
MFGAGRGGVGGGWNGRLCPLRRGIVAANTSVGGGGRDLKSFRGSSQGPVVVHTHRARQPFAHTSARPLGDREASSPSRHNRHTFRC